MKKLGVGLALLALLAGLLWWGLGRRQGGAGDDAPLAFVPADTPYVFANLEPLPQAVLDKMMAQSAETLSMYGELMAPARAELAKSEEPGSKQMLAVFDALVAEFEGKSPQQINDGLGIGLRSRFALYGIGWVPVLRLELEKPENLRAFIGRMETAAGEALPKSRLDAIDYWEIKSEQAPLKGVVAIIDRHLVATLAPATADAAVLKTLFGLQRPAQPLIGSGTLEALNSQYGFAPYFSGYLDNRRLLAVLTAEAPSAVDQAFAAALGMEQPELDATCRSELAALAESWPRLVGGYTHWDTTRNESRLVLETRKEIAEQLLKLRAPMPAAGQVDAGSIINFGLSFKLAALPEVVNGFAAGVAKQPWQCAQLTSMNEGFAQAKQGMSNPAVFAAAPVFSGFHAIVDSFDYNLATPDKQPSATGVLLIGSDNPQSLIAMAKGFAPPLAALELPVDGSVVALPAIPEVPAELALFAASNGKVIGLGIGSASEQRLPGLLQADPEQQPLLVMGVSAKFYALLADFMAQSAASDANQDEQARELLKKQAELMRTLYAKMFTRLEMRIEFSEHGIELRQRVDMP